eukprot:2987703-Heterocapsa_arctica.AAC.1
MANSRLAMMAIIGKLPGYRFVSAGLKFAGVPSGWPPGSEAWRSSGASRSASRSARPSRTWPAWRSWPG